MKNILLITTGGTIASIETEHGMIPSLDGDKLLSYLPEINSLCNVDIISLYNLDSTNIYYKHWLKIASTIKENYDKYDGFVICHGTDTMSYTASALSYLIQDSEKPIVLTGAQRSINFDFSDAKTNLLDSFTYACDELSCGVVLIFNGIVKLGTRARKSRTKSFDAFKSVDFPKLAIVKDNMVIHYITNLKKETKFYDTLNPKVGLMKLIPGTDEEVLEFMLKKYDAIIIESFGVGGLPTFDGAYYNDLINKYAKLGKIVVMTTQVPNEGSDIAIYKVGHYLKQIPSVLEAYDMTTEAVVTKLMWVLSLTKDIEVIKELFYKTISNDILFKKD